MKGQQTQVEETKIVASTNYYLYFLIFSIINFIVIIFSAILFLVFFYHLIHFKEIILMNSQMIITMIQKMNIMIFFAQINIIKIILKKINLFGF